MAIHLAQRTNNPCTSGVARVALYLAPADKQTLSASIQYPRDVTWLSDDGVNEVNTTNDMLLRRTTEEGSGSARRRSQTPISRGWRRRHRYAISLRLGETGPVP